MRCDKAQVRKIGAVTPHITGKYRDVQRRGVGANEKIGQDAGSGAACGAIASERLCGEKRSRPRYFYDLSADLRDKTIDSFDAGIAARQLRVDDDIDMERSLDRLLLKSLKRPFRP